LLHCTVGVTVIFAIKMGHKKDCALKLGNVKGFEKVLLSLGLSIQSLKMERGIAL
jgi:hypothetical protein